jgi:hypothetical protein
MTAKRRPRGRSPQINAKPNHQRLSWPGLKANDHLSRVVTRAVKEAKELEENEAWAESLISRVLDYVPARTVIELVERQATLRRLIAGSGGWLRSSECRGRRRGGGRRRG